MSLLKSAWEIALEKTDSIKPNPEKTRLEALRTEGRKLAGLLLASDDPEDTSVEKAYAQYSAEDKVYVREGIATTVVMNIALPQQNDIGQRLDKLQQLVKLVDGKQHSGNQVFEQLKRFLEQYITAREKLIERAKQQYLPIFQEKQERLAQKYGKGVDLSMEQDPEFIQMLQNGFSQLNGQYQRALDQGKEQLKAVWNIA